MSVSSNEQQQAEGVDDETWCHHLELGNFSEWFRWIVKDAELADQARDVEKENGSAEETKKSIIKAIRSKYTLCK